MKNIKFVVKVNRGGARGPAYVQSIDRTPLQMTTNRKLALLMGDSLPKTPSSLSRTPAAPLNWCPCRLAPSLGAQDG